jgi:hypothetical protein
MDIFVPFFADALRRATFRKICCRKGLWWWMCAEAQKHPQNELVWSYFRFLYRARLA